MDEPYERLKELTRGRRITGADLRSSSPGWACPTTPSAPARMTPASYTGLAGDLVRFLDR